MRYQDVDLDSELNLKIAEFLLNLKDKNRSDMYKQLDYSDGYYKFYWNTALKVSAFFVVSIGSSLAFYASHPQFDFRDSVPIFCFIVSFIYSFLTIYGTFRASEMQSWFETLSAPEALNLIYVKDVQPLVFYLFINHLLGITIGIACLLILKFGILFIISFPILVYILLTIMFFIWPWLAKRFKNKAISEPYQN